ncbi:hypothetical protein [Rufibacter roseus]|uniref:DUF3352 domain-containing protein n=1 Tax=Rufibacter roseus TaxID=1567108 RepID=A0ABW2DKQ4_9BACT|nr:hypothetical protein [Rufibacter roseus]
MPKKTILLLCGLVVLVALGFYGFSKWSEARAKVDLWTLVPDDAVFVVETDHAPRLVEHLKRTDLWGTLTQTPYVLRLEDQLTLLDSLSSGRSQLRNFLDQKNILMSLHVLGKAEQELVYYVPVNTVAEHRYVRTLVENLGKADEYRLDTRDYQGYQITDVISETNNNNNLTYFSYHNNLVISASSVLVEEIVRKINRGQLESPAQDYKNTNYLSQPDVFANVFINYRHLPDLLNTFLKEDLRDDVNMLSSLCRNSMLGLKIQNNRLFLNGFSNPETVEGALFGQMDGHKPKKLMLRELVPARAALLLHMGLDQVGALRREPGKAAATFIDTLANSFAGELGLCYLEAHDIRTSAEKVLFVQSGNPALSQTMLNRMQPGNSAGTQEKHGENIIRLLTVKELPQQLFGPMFKGFEQTYYTTVRDYLLFTDDVATMRTLLNDIDVGKVWSKSGAMEPMLEEMQQENNLGLFINTPNAWNLLLRSVNKESQSKLMANNSVIKKFNSFTFQFSAAEDQYYTSIILRHQEESGVKAILADQGLWQIETFDLKSQLISKPFLTQHPIDKSDEVVVQDSAFVLHAIGAQQGKRNWSDSLSSKVIGSVQQYPYGPNDRLTYFFATSNKIHCVDRNGRALENFPFNLGDSTRLQHLNVFDYDKAKDYRLVVDDALGNVFIMNMEGNLQQGWDPKRLESRLASAPQHFKVNGRNVILVVLENGYIYAFNNQGEAYPGFPIYLNTNLKSEVYGRVGISFRRSNFTLVTQSGEVITFDLTGEITKREQLVRPDRRSAFKMVVEPNGKSYIIARTDPGRVALYSQDLRLLLDRRFVTSSPKEVQFFHFGGDRQLYVVTETGPGKAYLFDVQAKLLGKDPIDTHFPVSVRYDEVKNQYTVFSTDQQVVQKTIVQGR